MEELFKTACCYLNDNRLLLQDVIPVSPLVDVIDGYCRSELLFENVILDEARIEETLYQLVALMNVSTEPAVRSWIKRVAGFISDRTGTEKRKLYTALIWVSDRVCLRPRCYYATSNFGGQCICGWTRSR